MTIFALFHNMAIKEIPIDYRDRPAGGVSKLNTVRDGCKVLLTIFKLFRDNKPLIFFSALAAFLLLAVVGLMIPIFAEYMETSLVPRTPTVVVCAAMGICSIVSFVCGVILECQTKKHAQLMEILMNLTAKQ